jgi:hypothetical protein
MSDVNDLTFVTTDALVRELLNRCECCVVVAQYFTNDDSVTIYSTPYGPEVEVCQGWLSSELDLLRHAGHRLSILNEGLDRNAQMPEANT